MNTPSFVRICILIQCFIAFHQSCYASSIESDLTTLIEFWNNEQEDEQSDAINTIIQNHIQLHMDSDKDVFLEISNQLFQTAEYEVGLKYFQMIKEINKYKSDELKGVIYYHLGRYYNVMNQRYKAEENYSLALNVICNSKYLFRIYSGLLDLYIKTDEYDMAIEYGLIALLLCDQYKASNIDYFEIHRSLISAYSGVYIVDKIDYHMQKLYFYSNKVLSPRYNSLTKLTQAGIYLSTGRYYKGIDLLKEIESIDEQENHMKSVYYYYLGLSFLIEKNYSKAIKLFNLSLSDPIGVRPRQLALSHSWLGDCYAFQCEFDKAINESLLAIEIYEQAPDLFWDHLKDDNTSIGNYYLSKCSTSIGNSVFMKECFRNSLNYYLKAKNYSQGNIRNLIFINKSLIYLFGDILKEEFTPDNLKSLFSLIRETMMYIVEWNFDRHYIAEDHFREFPIQTFFQTTLDVLYFLSIYTAHPLIDEYIINFSSGLQSLIYNNNRVKFDPFIDVDASEELRNYEREMKLKISDLKRKQNNLSSKGKESFLKQTYLDSLNMLKEEYKTFMLSNSQYMQGLTNTSDVASFSVKSIQEQLEPDEAIINYYNSNQHLYSTVITSNSFAFYRKDLDSLDNSFVVNFRESISNPNFRDIKLFEKTTEKYINSGRELYKLLLKKELDGLETKPEHLIVITYDKLHALPFNALLTRAIEKNSSPRDYPYLIKNYSIAYEYSLQSFLYHNNKKRKVRENNYVGVSPDYEESCSYVVADTIVEDDKQSNFTQFALRGGIAELPYAKQSVIYNSKFFDDGVAIFGADATKQNFLNYSGRADITHMAMHAVFDNENPDLSQFIFSGTNEESNLHAYELFDINMDTEIAMLSACDTGQGKVQSGMSIQNISQAFSLAGASSLTMSFYKIPDTQTAVIDKYFLEYVQEGYRVDEALRQSNLKYLDQSSEKYAHPFYWAGIAMSGKTEPLKKRTFLNKLFL